MKLRRANFKDRLAWYVGRQAKDNSVEDGPSEPYLCELPVNVPERCRYGAHLGRLRWRDREFTVIYYADPDARRFYAQPHPEAEAAPEWGLTNHRVDRPFPEALAFVRSVFAHLTKAERDHVKEKHLWERWWKEYASWRKDYLPPPPLDIPADPASAYRDSGWSSYQDWLWLEPPKKKKTNGSR